MRVLPFPHQPYLYACFFFCKKKEEGIRKKKKTLNCFLKTISKALAV